MNNGDKVVCVDDSPSKCPCCMGVKDERLILNNVYVVRNAVTLPSGRVGLELLGMTPPHKTLKGGTYDVYRFRLLDEMKAEAACMQCNCEIL